MPRPHPSAAQEPLPWKSSPGTTPSIEARFTIGRDSLGHWTVTDREDHVGGTFISEAAAFSFARQEAGHDVTQIRRSDDGAIIAFSLH